jgi:thiol-disulfide isomerase/thioredoxin
MRLLVLALSAISALAQSVTVPDFEVRDLSGRLWTAAHLRGKVTLVDIWSTGCGPCRREHPQLQRFHESAKSVQVLTFSLDEDPKAVQAYLKQTGFTFPVIVAGDLTHRLFGQGGIPQRWIVDRSGRRSAEPPDWSLGQFFYEAERLAAVTK